MSGLGIKNDLGQNHVGLGSKNHRGAVLAVFFVLLLLLCTIVLGRLVLSSHAQQKEMQEQLDFQTEMINALREQQDDTAEENEIVTITSETLRSQLNNLSELITEEYIYTNADKRESSETWIFGWTRPFSGNSLLVTYDGTIKAGIDLSQVQIDVDEDKRAITVTLPASRITDNNIPQETINVVEVKNGLFNDVTFDNYNDFISEQKLVMEKKAIDQGLLTKADENARKIIETFLKAIPGMDTYTLKIQ